MPNPNNRTSNSSPLVYVAAVILTLGVALPLAFSTENTRQALFDECYEEPCQTQTVLAELD